MPLDGDLDHVIRKLNDLVPNENTWIVISDFQYIG
jgi:hypothetical protein